MAKKQSKKSKTKVTTELAVEALRKIHRRLLDHPGVTSLRGRWLSHGWREEVAGNECGFLLRSHFGFAGDFRPLAAERT